MKKITLSLVFLLTMVLSGYGQVSYDYGWEPAGLGSWTVEGYSRTTLIPCTETASVRANVWEFNANLSLTSPSLGTSNGGLVTLNFDYKVINYSGNTAALSSQVDMVTEWSNSASGPWTEIGVIGESNHISSATCATISYTFSATPGDFFVRFKTNYLNDGDVYYYFDTINVSQGAAPSCVSPTGLTASNVLSSSATLNWEAVTPTPSLGYEYYYLDVNQAPSAAGTATTALSGDITGLIPNTKYYFWVKSICADGQSVWNGPLSFRTLCVSFDDFIEDFSETTAATGAIPNCWTKTITSTNINANVSVISNTFASAPNAISMTNSSDVSSDILLVSPALTAIGENTHRMKFKARGGTAGQILIVGTMSDATDATTFTPLSTFTLTANYLTYNVTMNTSTTDNHIAFKHGLGGTFRTVYLDDVVWEEIPFAAPGCIEDMNTVPDVGCGNFPTTFTWDAIDNADGYKVSIGTSPDGEDLVVDNVDINSALNYSFVGDLGTTYYYTIAPYNAFGTATDCFEDNFTTYDDGCYCEALPTSNDGAGISSVQINDVVTTVGDVLYGNFIENGAIDITQGLNTIMNVTLATGATYFTHVWVDFNDNFTFEASELVYTGESGATNPFVLNTSFVVPATAAIGEHRMRIVATDYVQTPANPCYSSIYGVALEFLVNVLPAPDCFPPSATSVSAITATSATLSWVSTGTLFNVELLSAGQNQGSGTVTSGIAANTLNLSGLNPQTNYSYFLQTDCGSGSLSPWTGPFNFRTGCEAFGNFTESFITEVTIPAPECWYTIKGTADAFARIQVSSFGDYVEMYNSNDAAAALYLVTPVLTDLPLNLHRIKFRAYSGNAGVQLVVGTMSDPSDASTFTAVQTIPMTNAFAIYSVPFASSTTDSHVAFKFVGTSTYQYMYIDDVTWEVNPNCQDVNVVAFGGSTSTTADISWTPGGTESAWQYAYAESTVNTPEGLTTFDVATTPSTTITDLTPSTSYRVWVRSVCNGTDFGAWSPSITFVTACVAFDAPYAQNFDTFPPLCWSRAGAGTVATGPTGTDTGIWAADGFLNAGSTGATSINLYFSGRIGWLISPSMNTVTGETYNLSFNYGVTTWLGTESIAMGSDDSVKVVMTTDNGVTWTEIQNFTAASNVSNVSQDFTYEYVATSSAVKFAFVGTDGIIDDESDYNFYIDNVAFESELSNVDFDSNSFTAYPNPVKDVLNVSFTQNISNVTVYNLLGQQVLIMNMNANKGQVDMSSLASGTYLVKVSTENAVKTIKVIKQ